MWDKILKFFKKAATALYSIVMPEVKKAVTDIINDAAVQEAAKEAVKAAATKGLKNNEALDDAVKTLKEAGIAAGQDAANTILKTVVQNAYCAIKCKM